MKNTLTEAAIYLLINAVLPLALQMFARAFAPVLSSMPVALAIAGAILVLNVLRVRRGRLEMVIYSVTIILNVVALFLFGMWTYITFIFVML